MPSAKNEVIAQAVAQAVAKTVETAAPDCITKIGDILANNATGLVIAAIAQVCFGFLYYGLFLAGPWTRAIAVDKGVKQLEYMKFRYSSLLCFLSSFAVGALRAAAVVAVMTLLGEKYVSLCMYQQAALFLSVVSQTNIQSAFWCQRPWALIVIDALNEVINFQVAAYAVFQATYWK
jgi:hypothetical protein